MASIAPSLPAGDRVWRRFTPAQRLGRFAIYLLLVMAIVASLRTIEIIPEFLYDAPEQVVDLVTRMWPIAHLSPCRVSRSRKCASGNTVSTMAMKSWAAGVRKTMVMAAS